MKKTFLIIFGSFILLSVNAPSPASAQVLELIMAPSFLVEKGRNALRRGDMDTAERYLEKALKRKVRLSTDERRLALTDICAVYNYKSKYKAALEACSASILMMSNRWEAYNNRGNAYFGLGDYASAIKDYQKALTLNGDEEIISTNLELALGLQAASGGSGENAS